MHEEPPKCKTSDIISKREEAEAEGLREIHEDKLTFVFFFVGTNAGYWSSLQ